MLNVGIIKNYRGEFEKDIRNFVEENNINKELYYMSTYNIDESYRGCLMIGLSDGNIIKATCGYITLEKGEPSKIHNRKFSYYDFMDDKVYTLLSNGHILSALPNKHVDINFGVDIGKIEDIVGERRITKKRNVNKTRIIAPICNQYNISIELASCLDISNMSQFEECVKWMSTNPKFNLSGMDKRHLRYSNFEKRMRSILRNIPLEFYECFQNLGQVDSKRIAYWIMEQSE